MNVNTLADAHAKVSQERDMKIAVTGPEGPFHNIAENLKNSGAYGDKIMKESKANAKYGKKIVLPKFKSGGAKDYVAGQNIPYIYAQTGDKVPDPFKPDEMVENSVYNMLDQTGNTQWKSPTTNTSYNRGSEDFVDQVPQRQMNFATGQNVPGFTATTPSNTPAVTPTQATPELKAVYNRPSSSGTYGTVTPTGQNILTYPGANQQSWDNSIDATNKWYTDNKTPLPSITPEEIKKYGFQTPEQIQNATAQRGYYKMKMSTPQGRNDLANMWENLGMTHQGQKLGMSLKPGELLSLDPNHLQTRLGDLETAFIDGMPVARKLDSPKANPLQLDKQVNDDAVSKLKGVDLNGIKNQNHNYYQRGLEPEQYIGELSTLLDRYEPAPFIVNQGNKEAYAMGVRPESRDVQAELNHNQRATMAATRYRQNTPESQALLAQMKTNEMAQNSGAWEGKHHEDSQNNANFIARQQGLLSAAGADQEKGLRQGSIDSAKGHSAFSDRRINAASLLGNKFAQNARENRQSALVQDMFPNFAVNPLTFGTDWAGNNARLSVGNAYGTPKEREAQELAQYRYLHGKYFGAKAEQVAEGEKPTTASQKFGGKVKLPKKAPKRIK